MVEDAQTYSLKTEILMEFSKAMEESEKFEGKISSLAERFGNLSQEVRQFDLSFSDKLARVLEDIKKDNIEINGKYIKESLEQELANAFTHRRVRLKNLEREDGTVEPLNVKLGREAWRRLREQIEEKLEMALEEGGVSRVNLGKITISTQHIKNLQNKLHRAIHKSIEENLEILIADDADIVKWRVTGKQFQNYINAVRDKLVQHLADPKNIVLGNVPQMKIDSEGIKQAIEEIRKSIGDLDKKLVIDAEQLKKLPDVQPKIEKLMEELKIVIKSILNIADSIDKIDTKADAEKLNKLKNKIVELRTIFLDRMVDLANFIVKEIAKEPISAKDMANVQGALNKIKQHINDYIEAQVDASINALLKNMGFTKTKVDGKEVYVAGVNEIQDRILQASMEAVKEIKKADLEIDTELVVKAFKQWATQMSQRLAIEADSAIQKLTAEILVQNKVFLDSFMDSVSRVVRLSLSKNAKVDKPINVRVPIQGLREKVQNDLRNEILRMLSKANIDFGMLEGTFNVNVPNQVIVELNDAIREIIIKQSKVIVNQIKSSDISTEMIPFSISRINQIVSEESSRIVNAVISQVKGTLRELYSGFSDVGSIVEGDTQGERQELRSKLNQGIQLLISNYANQMEDALGVLTLSASSLDNIKTKINHELNQLMQRIDVEFTDKDFPIQLKGVIRTIQQKIQQEIRSNVEAWKPELDGFKLNKATVNKIMTPLENAIKLMFEDLAQHIKGYVDTIVNKVGAKEEGIIPSIDIDGLMKPVNNAIQTQMKNYIVAISKLMTETQAKAVIDVKKLHKDVRKSLAKDLGMKVSEMDKSARYLEGDTAFQTVIRKNIETIMDKFNEVIFENTKKGVIRYEEELEKIDIKPDLSPVHYLTRQMADIQKEIVNKVKEILRAQFKAMKEEIRNIQLLPISMGYTPPQHVTKAVQKGVSTPSISAVVPIGDGGGRRGGYVSPVNTPRRRSITNPGGDTRSWMGSVRNTMRYITAGALMGIPWRMYYESWESAKELDYQMERARQNFLMKGAMEKVARGDLFNELGEERFRSMSFKERNELIKERADYLRDLARDGSIDIIQDIALANSIDTHEVGKAFHIASRRFQDPREAIALTEAVSKLRAIEEVDVEESAKGLEAIGSQWGVGGQAMNRIANMLLMTESMSQATVEDLLETQKKSGNLFRQALPGMKKDEALATSFALSSMFIQATARTGKEGGTFWRAMLERPFQEPAVKMLQELSADPFLKEKGIDISPWTGTGERRNFVDLFSNLIEASMVMDDKSRMRLYDVLFPRRHGGSAQSIMTFMQDLQEEAKKIREYMVEERREKGEDTDITIKESIQEYVEKILNVDEKQIYQMRAGMADTWKFRVQRLRTMWQASTFGVYEELKDEFGVVTDNIIAFLGLIRENTETVANLINAVSKIAIGIGSKMLFDYGRGKLPGFINWATGRTGRMNRAYNTNRDYLEVEGKVYNLRRLALQDEMLHTQKRIDRNNRRRVEIGEQLQRYNPEFENINQKLSSARNERQQLEVARTEASSDEERKKYDKQIEAKTKHIKNLEMAQINLQKKVKPLQDEMKSLDKVNEKLSNKMGRLAEEIGEVDVHTVDLRNRMEMLDLAYRDVNGDSRQLNNSISYLNTGIKEGTMTVQKYESEVKQLARASGVSDDGLKKLRVEVDKLSKEFKEGTIDAKSFVRQLNQLERAYVTGKAGIKGGGVGGRASSQQGFGLMEAVVAGSMFKGSMDKGRGIFSTIFKKLGLFGRVSKIPGAGKVVRSVQETGKILKRVGGVVGKTGRFGKALGSKIPGLGWILYGADALNMVWDIFGSRFMSEGERMATEANKLQQLVERASSVEGAGLLNPMKYLYGFDFLVQGVMNSVSNLFGGTAPSAKQNLKALMAMIQADDEEELKKILQKEFGYEDLKVQAEIQKMKEYRKNIDKFDIDGDGELDTEAIAPNSIAMSVQGVSDLIEYLNEDLQAQLTELQTMYESSRLGNLLKGYREDSEEMLEVQRTFLESNIELLNNSINELEDRLERMKVDTIEQKRAKDELEKYTNELRMQRDSYKFQLHELNTSTLSRSILSKLDRQSSLLEAKYGIKQSKAILGGAQKDSLQVKLLEEAKLSKISTKISETVSELRKLRDKYKDNEKVREDLTLQILQLQKEQQDILVKIKDEFKNSMSTYNLPSGIRPMTYYEAMSKSATHQNITVRSGDTIINLNIDNMTGSNEDIEKITQKISEAVRDLSRNVASVPKYAGRYPIRRW